MSPWKHDEHADRMVRAIRRIIRAVEVRSRRLMADHDVTGPQLSALNVLYRRGELTGTRIAKALLLSPSTIVGVVDRLEEKGLVERRRDTVDRRRVMVRLTDSGQKLVRKIPNSVEWTLATKVRGIPEAERRRLATALEKCVHLMGADDISADPLDDTDTQSQD